MHNKRLLTIDDLYSYYVNQGKNCYFDSNKENTTLIVQVPSTMQFKKSEKDVEGLCPVELWSSHIGKNLNGSFISEKSMKAALPSFANRPILGFIHEVDGEPEFYAHNMHIGEDDEIIYDEIPVGIIPESGEPHLEVNEDNGKTYVVVNGYIFEDYTKAADILRKHGECYCSVELSIRELSYDAAEKVLNIEDFWFSGVTVLGFDEEGQKVMPGMTDAHISISDFSKDENSMFSHNEKLIETLDKLNETLARFNINPAQSGEFKEGGCLVNKFEELLRKYNKNVEDVTFEYDGLTDEELEAKFAEAFGDPTSTKSFDGDDPDEGTDPVQDPVEDPVVDPAQDPAQDPEPELDPVIDPDPVPQSTEEDQAAADEVADVINALTDESTAEDVEAARAAYNALTETQRGLVSAEVVAILEAQEARIENEKAVDAVVETINALTDDSDFDAVSAARAAYDKLTDDQKELVPAEVLEALEEQETRVNNEPQNDDTPKKKKYAITCGEDKREFSVSMSQVLSAMTDLVNATYSEADNDWYMVDVYESEKSVVFVGMWTGAAYKQSYKVRNDVYSLVGDRVPVKCCYLTSDEEAELDRMRSNYAAIETKLGQYEAEPEKIAVFESDEYANIRESEEFVALREEKNHFDLSVDEVKERLDSILLAYAKSGNLKFEENRIGKKYPTVKKLFGNTKKNNKSGRYGNLFAKN